MWLINSSIGRKVVMSVTGLALVLFLTFHASMNVVALFSAHAYNMICEFLGANWYAVVATVGLAGLMGLHFVYAFWLTYQNRRARGTDRYAVADKPKQVEWASQNMLVLGVVICLGLLLHLYNFWYNMMYAELLGIEGEIGAADGAGHIVNTFAGNWIYTFAYVVWLIALWFHMNHGFWSAMQTVGWNGKIWFNRWRTIGCVFTTFIVGLFAIVLICFAAGYTPVDYSDRLCESEYVELQCGQDSQQQYQNNCSCSQNCEQVCQEACKETCNGVQ